MVPEHPFQAAVVFASSRPNAEKHARAAQRQTLRAEQNRQVAAQASSTPSGGCEELLGSADLSADALPAGALITGWILHGLHL